MIKALAKQKPIAEPPAAEINARALIARCQRRRSRARGAHRPGDAPLPREPARRPVWHAVLIESPCFTVALFNTSHHKLSCLQNPTGRRRGVPPAPPGKVCFARCQGQPGSGAAARLRRCDRRPLSLPREKYCSAKLKVQGFGAPGHTAQRLLAHSNSLSCRTHPAPQSA